MVSLKSPSSVEYGIKKFFCASFSRTSYCGLKFVKIRPIWVYFIHILRNFLLKISSIFLKYVKIINNIIVDLIFKDKKVLLTNLI